MELEIIIQLISLVSVFIAVTWKVAGVKDSLEDDLDRKIQPLRNETERTKDKLVDLRSQLALLESRHNADVDRVNDRVNNLHRTCKSKISDLSFCQNELIDFLEKNKIGEARFLKRNRDKETLDSDSDSWTELRGK